MSSLAVKLLCKLQETHSAADLYKKDVLRHRVTYALLLKGKLYVPAFRSGHWAVTVEHRELPQQTAELWCHTERNYPDMGD